MILEAIDLEKEFPPLRVIQGVSLQVQAGESIAIMGKSGEGKSTLLHLLGSLEKPSSGRLTICGHSLSAKDAAQLRNRHIGFVFQSYYLLEDFTVLDNVLMPMKIGRKKGVSSLARAKELLKEVGLLQKESAYARTLSGGEKQRVAIARALANDPDLILADEPTGNLDEEHSKEVQDLLLFKAKQQQKALIVVTHDPSLAQSCDRLFFLKGGRLYNSAS